MVRHRSRLGSPLFVDRLGSAALSLLIVSFSSSLCSAEFIKKSGYGKISSVYNPQTSVTPAQSMGRPGIDRPYTEAEWYAKCKADMHAASPKAAAKPAAKSAVVTRPNSSSAQLQTIVDNHTPQKISSSSRSGWTPIKTITPAETVSPVTPFDAVTKMSEKSMKSVSGTRITSIIKPGEHISFVKVDYPSAMCRMIPASKSSIKEIAPDISLLDLSNGKTVVKYDDTGDVVTQRPGCLLGNLNYQARNFSDTETRTIANTVSLLPSFLRPKGFAAGQYPDAISDDEKTLGGGFAQDGYVCFMQAKDTYGTQCTIAHETGHVYYGNNESSSYLSPTQRMAWNGIWNESVKRGLPDDDFTCDYAQSGGLTRDELKSWKINDEAQSYASGYRGSDPLTVVAFRKNGTALPEIATYDGGEMISSMNDYWFRNSEALTNQGIEKARAGNDLLLQKVSFFTNSIYGESQTGQGCIGKDFVKADCVYTFTMGDNNLSGQKVKTKTIKINDKTYTVPDFDNPVGERTFLSMGENRKLEYRMDLRKILK